jgi:hypothetical protein
VQDVLPVSGALFLNLHLNVTDLTAVSAVGPSVKHDKSLRTRGFQIWPWICSLSRSRYQKNAGETEQRTRFKKYGKEARRPAQNSLESRSAGFFLDYLQETLWLIQALATIESIQPAPTAVWAVA